MFRSAMLQGSVRSTSTNTYSALEAKLLPADESLYCSTRIQP